MGRAFLFLNQRAQVGAAVLLAILVSSPAHAEQPEDEPRPTSQPESARFGWPATQPAGGSASVGSAPSLTPPGKARVPADRPKVAGRVSRAGSFRFFLGAGGLAMVPLGRWRRHAYAGRTAPSDLVQFGPGGGGRIEAGLHWRRLGVALALELSSLYTGEWDRYATRQGTTVQSRALCVGLFPTLSGVVATIGPVAFDLHVGLGYAQPVGHERLAELDLEYNLSFVRPTLSFRQGGSVVLALPTLLDLLFGVDNTIGTSPVQYDSAAYWTVTFHLGVRFYPRGRPWR